MSNISLNGNVNLLKGVGDSQSQKLEKLNIYSIKDFFFNIPFRYRDTSDVLDISSFKQLKEGTFIAQIISVRNIFTKYKKVITKVKVKDLNDSIELTYFNQSYLSKSLKEEEWYIFDGKISEGKVKGVFNPKYEKYAGDISEQKHLGKIYGIYHEGNGIQSRWIRKTLIDNKDLITDISDPLDKELLQDTHLETLNKSIQCVHFPNTREDINLGRERLAFDEMLNIALDIEKDILSRKTLKGKSIKEDVNLTEDFLDTLPYTLTKDQLKAYKEIIKDISTTKPMNRLLNGDVGSGKTVVAALAILQSIRNGYSCILLAPTTVLAQQHFNTLNNILKPFNIDIELWISSTKKSSESNTKLIIGTHAILFKKDIPRNLNLVIVDEQHRFGVQQREYLLKQNKHTPHYLAMTATPIPRSLTEIVFGNIDVSLIKEKPSNRKDILTYFVPHSKRNNCFKWIKDKISESNKTEQAFIVYPIIEESQSLDLKAVKTEYENLKNNEFSNLSVALLHGKLSNTEKEDILKDFKEKKYNILVTTSVIEVGIDIPDATIMVVEDAHRFGLAQLHQLRGRVGRGDTQSYCYVIAGKKDEDKESSVERLKYFASHNSGFDVAEYDLQKRGPGEVYGIKQSGVPIFKVASITDIELLKKARKVAKKLLTKDNTQLEYIKENLFR